MTALSRWGQGGAAMTNCTVHEHPCHHVYAVPLTPRMLSAPQVWSTRCERSVAVLDVKANVCSVRFNPWEPHQVGSVTPVTPCMMDQPSGSA